MAVKQSNTMPLSLVVREQAWLKQDARDDISFVFDQDNQGLPLVVTTVENEGGQQIVLTITPSQLDALIEELKEVQCAVQWQMARSHWLFVRYGKSKWHLRLSQWRGGQLCTTRPRYESTAIEVVEAGTTLWNGSVCQHCVQLWTEQVLSGWIRYQYASTRAASSPTHESHEATACTEGG